MPDRGRQEKKDPPATTGMSSSRVVCTQISLGRPRESEACTVLRGGKGRTGGRERRQAQSQLAVCPLPALWRCCRGS